MHLAKCPLCKWSSTDGASVISDSCIWYMIIQDREHCCLLYFVFTEANIITWKIGITKATRTVADRIWWNSLIQTSHTDHTCICVCDVTEERKKKIEASVSHDEPLANQIACTPLVQHARHLFSTLKRTAVNPWFQNTAVLLLEHHSNGLAWHFYEFL